MRRPEVIERIRPIGGIQRVGQLGFIMMQVLELKFIELDGKYEFEMRNDELLFLTGIKNRETLNNVRKQLSQLDILLSYKSARGKSGGTYTLSEQFFPKLSGNYVGLTDNLNNYVGLTDNFQKNMSGNHVDLTDNPHEKLSGNYVGLTDNLDLHRVSSIDRKIEREIDRESDREIENSWSQICIEWEKMFRIMSPMDRERLVSYQDDDGMSPEVILSAIELAQSESIDSPKSYLWKTLNDWANQKIKTMRDVILYERERNQKPLSVRKGVKDAANKRSPESMGGSTPRNQAPPNAGDWLRRRDEERRRAQGHV